jgi:anthranilate synthase component 2
LSKVYHGIATPIKIKSEESGIKSYLFNNLPEELIVGRYHSWVVSDKNFPSELEITARDENGFVMALQHKKYDVQGVQFHPESVLTPMGETILKNWLLK